MFTVKIIGNEAKTMVFESKEALIRHYVAMESAYYIDPKTYIPKVFSDIAMNENDVRSVQFGKAANGDFVRSFFRLPQESRKTMVFDADGRIIDIRSWLPEFRAAMSEKLSPASSSKRYYPTAMGSKPRYRKTYRVAHGFKQAQMLPEEVDQEEILEYMSAVPVNMTRRQCNKYDDWKARDRTRSWKEQSKCRKSWQIRSGQPSVRQIHKRDWEEEIENAELELIEEQSWWEELIKDVELELNKPKTAA